MTKRATRCSIGLQDDQEDPHRGNSFKTPTEVHMANHRVMKYQDEYNEKQLHLNLNLIDEVRMNTNQRTTRYKNLLARQYDAMVKLMHFNIGDLVLKNVARRNPTYGKLEPNWEGPYRVINCKRQGSYYLETLDGRKLEHSWNVEHLRRYYQQDISLDKHHPGRDHPRRCGHLGLAEVMCCFLLLAFTCVCYQNYMLCFNSLKVHQFQNYALSMDYGRSHGLGLFVCTYL